MATRARRGSGLAGLGRVGFGNKRGCTARWSRLWGVKAGKIGRHFYERVVIEKLYGIIHRTVAAGTRLVSPQLTVKISWTLASKIGHTRALAHTECAMTPGAGRVYDALAFGNISFVRIKRPQIVDVSIEGDRILSYRAGGICDHDACDESARHRKAILYALNHRRRSLCVFMNRPIFIGALPRLLLDC
jgi:hypothetical protein